MIDAKQPLIYFANNSDFVNEYDNTAANEDRNKQAVFVGDNHMIYTHGVAFNGNDTIYNDTELRGLINNALYDDTELRGLIGNHDTFLTGLSNRLDGIYTEISDNVDADIKALLKNAQWLKDNFANGNIGEVFPFENWDDDLKQYMIGLGLIEEYEENGETKTRVGWSSLLAQYDSLQATVAQLESGDVDQEALEAALKLYIDDEVGSAEARLDTKYALTDAEGRALEWLSSGFESQSNQYETFANMYSAAMTNYGDAISGISTRVSILEGAGYLTEAQVGTKVNNAVTGLDARITANENSISAMSDFGTRIGTVESGLSTVATKAGNNETAIASMFAQNGAGTAAISTWVNNWWSGVTISADKVNLTGKQLNAIFGETEQDSSEYGLLRIKNNYLEIKKGTYNSGLDSVLVYPSSIFISHEKNPQTSGDVLHGVAITADELNFNQEGVGKSVLLTKNQFTIKNAGGGVNPDNHKIITGVTQHLASYPATFYYKNGDDEYGYISSQGFGFTYNDTETIFATASDGKISALEFVSENTYDEGDGSSKTERITLSSHNIRIFNEYEDGGTMISGGHAFLGMCPNNDTLSEYLGYGVDIDGINSTVTANTFDQSSDRTLKDIVSDTSLTVEQVAEAPAVNFTWKRDADKDNKEQHVGTIAQYWQVVLPEVVNEAKNGTLTMQYSNAAMISSIVTAKEVVALKEEIAELKRQIAELKAN